MLDNGRPVYTIGTAAEILGVHPRTLRLYEDGGLLRPARKNNRRFYSANDLHWIACIRYLIHANLFWQNPGEALFQGEGNLALARRLLVRIVSVTVAMELAGAFLLHGMAPGWGWFPSIFHAVSAFCNAGFSTLPGGLEPYQGQASVLLPVAALIVAGGYYFPQARKDVAALSVPALPVAGDVLRYTITLRNDGAIPATAVSLRDPLPANTRYVADSLWLNGLPVGQPDGGVLPLIAGIPVSSSDLTPPLPALISCRLCLIA